MPEIGRRRRGLPAPPAVVREALTHPDRDPARRWLTLLDDEVPPAVVASDAASLTWSSLWPRRPDVRVVFELPAGSDGGTDLTWRLLADDPPPDASLTGHLRRRVNELIHGLDGLRGTFGQ